MSNLAGLGIALLTIIAVCLLWFVIKGMFWLADELQELVLDDGNHILWRIFFLLPWIVLRLLTVIFVVIGLLCGISVAKDFWKWFNN